MTRREEREQAFILLFEKAFNAETEVAELYDFAIENEVITGSDFVKTLLLKTWENVENIDGMIEKYSVGWKLGRISKVALAVLRLAFCEILYFDDIPVGVSINEAVELCKKYAAKDDAAFVNGLLGSASKDIK
ncbi:MAG: transcription antitermination factor NusB [Clostridia bacterium]|nr:transcription antitermination factor NusB [Clostridia bacterium]